MKIVTCVLNFVLLGLVFFSIPVFSVSANAAEHAILEMECKYPESAAAGIGSARLSFESSSKPQYIDVTYVLNSAAMGRELLKNTQAQWISKSADHYVSAGGVYTVRNIERQKGLIDDACTEAISLLVAKVKGRDPVDISGVTNVELYLINGIGSLGWELVHKEVIDESTELSSLLTSKYYFRNLQ
jgi:hypothetical protein